MVCPLVCLSTGEVFCPIRVGYANSIQISFKYLKYVIVLSVLTSCYRGSARDSYLYRYLPYVTAYIGTCPMLLHSGESLVLPDCKL